MVAVLSPVHRHHRSPSPEQALNTSTIALRAFGSTSYTVQGMPSDARQSQTTDHQATVDAAIAFARHLATLPPAQASAALAAYLGDLPRLVVTVEIRP
jgi:hypothetical protein